jgi:SAM-dependent methyltransferase
MATPHARRTARPATDTPVPLTGKVDAASGKHIVFRVEDGWDRQAILCSTYQMRNIYRQLGDAYFTHLDVFNYIQHQQIALWCRQGNHVLDVCCGRGLILPLLRYYAKDIGSYTGVDIAPENATFLTRRVTDGKPLDDPATYYPFPVAYVEANVATMAEALPRQYDVVIYTSALEHMHPDMGFQSLQACAQVSRPGALLILTCPNTPEEQDGYQTRYRAHVYEWKRSELLQALQQVGFTIQREYGLTIERKVLQGLAKRLGFAPLLEQVASVVPPEWYLPVFAPMFPREATEIGFLCQRSPSP